jgi:excisionase family DNA binding protein
MKKVDQTKSPKFYTIDEIAECVGASTRTVRRWIDKGLLIAHRFDGLVRISETDGLSRHPPGHLILSSPVG